MAEPTTPDTILRGTEGFRAAMNDIPSEWQARICDDAPWLPFEDMHDNCWSVWDVRQISITHANAQWRRRPAKVEPPASRCAVFYDTIPASGGLRAFVPVHWIGAKVRVTIEEIIDKPAAELATGTIITWQEAQRRVDAGLAVDFHSASCDEWERIDKLRPIEYRGRAYRIPLHEAERESGPAADMTELRIQCDALERERGIWNSQLRDTTAEVERLKGELDIEKSCVKKLRSELSAARTQLASVPNMAIAILSATRVLNETAGRGQG